MSSSNSSLLPYGIVGVVAVAIIGGLVLQHRASTSTAMPMPSTSSQASSSPAVATNAVTLQNFAFSPAVITVKKGSSVTWTNQDDVNHSVTDDKSGTGPSSQLFGRDASYSYTFTIAGTFTYHCMPHPYMHGTVIVTN